MVAPSLKDIISNLKEGLLYISFFPPIDQFIPYLIFISFRHLKATTGNISSHSQTFASKSHPKTNPRHSSTSAKDTAATTTNPTAQATYPCINQAPSATWLGEETGPSKWKVLLCGPQQWQDSVESAPCSWACRSRG